jgi:site-specific recombinase XerD
VTCQKENQHQTRDRNEVFLPDRGIPDFAERTRRRIHEDINRASGSGVNINAAHKLTSSEKQFFVFFAPNQTNKANAASLTQADGSAA